METLNLYVVTENTSAYSKDSIIQLNQSQADKMKNFIKPFKVDAKSTEETKAEGANAEGANTEGANAEGVNTDDAGIKRIPKAK